jgi:hypothetical protein
MRIVENITAEGVAIDDQATLGKPRLFDGGQLMEFDNDAEFREYMNSNYVETPEENSPEE